MACEFEVLLNAEQHSRATEQAIIALDLVEQLEEQLSVYRHRSEVSQLNIMGRHRPVSVEARLFELLQSARQLYDDTQGAFDITSGELLWQQETARPFTADNGIEGHGGAIDVSGQTIADGWLYVQSGYAMFGQLPGNMLLAYRVKNTD